MSIGLGLVNDKRVEQPPAADRLDNRTRCLSLDNSQAIPKYVTKTIGSLNQILFLNDLESTHSNCSSKRIITIC